MSGKPFVAGHGGYADEAGAFCHALCLEAAGASSVLLAVLNEIAKEKERL